MGRLGVMQGRLSPPINNQIQAFPVDNWKKEFPHCKKLGITCIEWIFEFPTFSKNPLCTEDSISEIINLSKQYDVYVNSVVADYFMEKKLFGSDKTSVKNAVKTLEYLIKQCEKCQIPIIEIPLVDSSALKTENDKKHFIKSLQGPLSLAAEKEVLISLETSLPPDEFKTLIEAFAPYKVFVNFDMGNSASLGYDPIEEINLLGEFIINVHIKDRVRGGVTVPLGQGNTNFEAVFQALAECNYRGDFILQAARQDLHEYENKKSESETIKEYIDFINPFIKDFISIPSPIMLL